MKSFAQIIVRKTVGPYDRDKWSYGAPINGFTLPETNSSPLKIDPWKSGKGDSYWKPPFFRGENVSLRECKWVCLGLL